MQKDGEANQESKSLTETSRDIARGGTFCRMERHGDEDIRRDIHDPFGDGRISIAYMIRMIEFYIFKIGHY